jgi:hypothetical protein
MRFAPGLPDVLFGALHSAGMVRNAGEGAEVVEGDTKSGKPRAVDQDPPTATLLREHRRERGALALQLARDDALVFGDIEGTHRNPEHVSRQFARDILRCRAALGEDALPVIRLHDLISGTLTHAEPPFCSATWAPRRPPDVTPNRMICVDHAHGPTADRRPDLHVERAGTSRDFGTATNRFPPARTAQRRSLGEAARPVLRAALRYDPPAYRRADPRPWDSGTGARFTHVRQLTGEQLIMARCLMHGG